jgi:hypothetical protein
MATDGMPIDAREVALLIVESTWSGVTNFDAGHAMHLRAELRKHYKARKAA